MPGDKEEERTQERIARNVGTIAALLIAQMTNRDRNPNPWTQQELIIALHKGGVRPKDIAAALGTTRNAVDPVLSRYRKAAKDRKPAVVAREDDEA